MQDFLYEPHDLHTAISDDGLNFNDDRVIIDEIYESDEHSGFYLYTCMSDSDSYGQEYDED